MSRFLNLPLLDLCVLKPWSFSFDVPGSGIDGGRDGFGQSVSIETSGGGMVVGSYERCTIRLPEQHEYLNWLAARLNGGFRYIDVPIKTDRMGPFPVIGRGPKPFIRHIPHGDGSGFSDGSFYAQATVWGEVTEAADLNAGVVKMRVFGAARPIRWSDWFSIRHDDGEKPRGNRAYRTWETLASVPGSTEIFGETVAFHDCTVAITPPLRQAVPAGKRVEFSRPRFAGKFPRDFTLPWQADHVLNMTQPTIEFVEAF